MGQMVNHTANTDVQTCTKFPDALCENKPGYDYNDDEWRVRQKNQKWN